MNASELRAALHHAVRDAVTSPLPSDPKVSGALTDTFNQLIKFSSKPECRDLSLRHALTLMQAGSRYQLALDVFLRPSDYLNIEGDISIRVRFNLYSSLCRYYLTLGDDVHLKAPTTLETCAGYLYNACEAVRVAFPQDEALYYVIHDATVLLYTATLPLMKEGYLRESEVVLSWCVQCMDSALSLCTVKFLPWRFRLYSTLAQCHESRKDFASARRVANAFLKKASELRSLELSDFVLPTEAQCQTLQSGCDSAFVLATRYDILEECEGGKVASASALADRIRGALQASLTGENSEAAAKLQAYGATPSNLFIQTLLNILWEPGIRVVSPG